MSSSCQSQARCLHALGGETLRFSGNAAPGVAEVGSPKCRGLEREFDLHVKILKKTEAFRAAPDLGGRVPNVSAAGTLVDLVRPSCYANLQPAVGCEL